MGEAHILDVAGQALGQLLVGQEPVTRLRYPSPGPEVDLVDRDRGRVPLAPAALGHPDAVIPLVLERGDDRGRPRCVELECEGVGVGLERDRLARLSNDLVLVPLPLAHAGREHLPDSVGGVQAHRVAPTVPAVEVADDAHPPRVRRPHREYRPRHAVEHAQMGAEPLVSLVVGALGQEVAVVVAERRRETVRVVDRAALAVDAVDLEAVGEGRGAPGDHDLEQALRVDAGHLVRRARHVGAHQPHGPGVGHERADRRPDAAVGRHAVRAKDGERIAVLAAHDGLHRARLECRPAHDQALPARSRSRPRSGTSTHVGRLSIS